MYKDNKISRFDHDDAKMFKFLLNTDYFVDATSMAFWQIDTVNFDLPYPNQNEQEEFAYIHFINSSLGIYLDLFKLVIEKNPNNKDAAKQYIETIKDDNIRHFMMGRHYDMYTDSLPKTIYDLKGISSAYRLKNKGTSAFKNATLIALNEGYSDSLIEHNVAIVSLHEINPSKDAIAWGKINVFMIFMYIFNTNYDFPYQQEWLTEIMTRHASKYFNTIFRMFRKDNSSINSKINKLLLNPKEILKLSDEKINIALVTSKIDDIKNDLQPLFLKILTTIISFGRVQINGMSIQTIEMALEQSDTEKRKQMFNGLRGSMNLGDFNRLETKYSTI